jgi:hypothetical protein
MADYKDPAISDIGMIFSQEHALIDARDIIRELGQPVLIRFYEEEDTDRDEFNSIKNQDTTQKPGITFYAFPVIYNPTEKQLERVGIMEKTEVLIKIAMLDWTDAGKSADTLKDLNMGKAKVIIKGATYEVKTKQLDSQYTTTYLYIHLGLNRV